MSARVAGRGRAILVALAACGASGKNDIFADAGSSAPKADAASVKPDAYIFATGKISGTVFAPGNAPGMVPAGHEIPLSRALIYLSLTRAEPIPEGV